MSISTLISAVPDVVWAAAIGAVLALSGVLISNRSNLTRLKLELRHDAEQREKERKAALRREVYLGAAEELVRANAHLASLPQMDLSKSNPTEGLQGFFSAAAKLQLISEPKTAYLVGDLAGKYGELILKLLGKMSPIQSVRADIAIRDDHYHRTQSEIARILAAMKQFNESAQSEPRVFQALNRSFEFHQSQATKLAEERDGLWQQHNSLHRAFVKYLLTDLKQLAQDQVQVMVEIRRDLELEGDLAEFSRQMERNMERVSIQLDAVLNELAENA